MPERLVITSHRPQAGQEISRIFMEKYGVHAFSSPNLWPAVKVGELNRAVLNQQPVGMTCCMIEQPRTDDLVKILSDLRPSAIVHAPLLVLSTSTSPAEDYQSIVNSTLLWLEAARQACPTVPFIYLSSSQVYGDRANTILVQEQARRIDFAAPAFLEGITESFPVEGSTHSLVGAAAIAADILVQEFARSYHMPTCCLRMDSVCDPGNGQEDRRDMLSLLVHSCLTGTEYVVYGNQGKQVREIISARDVASLMEAFIQKPRLGEIYNVGGGKSGSCSVMEAMEWIERVTEKTINRRYVETPPLGEPHCYFSNTRHLRDDYPKWEITEPLQKLIPRVVEVQQGRLAN